MASLIKYNSYAEERAKGAHIWWGTTHTYKAILSNTTPNVATHNVRADVSELATGGGYTSGGIDIQNDGTRTGGTVYVAVTDVTWTNSGTLGPFRYIIIYNDTHASDALVGYIDIGEAVTLSIFGEPFTADFGQYLLTII
jgi:hypothetical protein